MNKKIYKKLMIAGFLPWRSDVLKKTIPKVNKENELLKEGWQYVNISKTLYWRNETWRLLYKIIDALPHDIPGFVKPTDNRYQYIEFMAINQIDGQAELYAYGNFLKGTDKAYVMRGKQLIRIEE